MLAFFSRNIVLSTLWLYWAGALLVYLLYNQHTYLFIVPYLLIAIFAVEIFIVFKKKNIQTHQENTSAFTAANTKTTGNKSQTIIALGSCFNGDINIDGDIHVYGQVTGNIQVKNGQIRVMQPGYIQGDLQAPAIIVDGCIEGLCVAESLEILENGRVKGIVRGNNLSIKKGGIFIGQSEITDKKATIKPPVAEQVTPPLTTAKTAATKA